MGIRTSVKQMLVRQQDKKYEAELAKLRVTYAQWAAEQEKATAGAQKMQAEGRVGLAEFVIYRQQKGLLADNAVERINAYFIEHPDAEIVYGDEDLLSESGERCIPWFKPCWSPDMYRGWFYVGSVIAVRSRLLQKLGEPMAVPEVESTGKEILFAEAREIRPLMDRLFLAAGGFERGCHTIGHMEEVLFHGNFGTAGIGIQGPQETDREKAEQTPWEEYRNVPESTKLSVELAARAAQSAGALFAGELLVSVIIPSKDNPEVLEKCLMSLTRRPAGGVPVEILLVDNGSNAENKKKTERLAERLRAGGTQIRYIYEPAEFNFSAMCNRGAELAEGKLLLFLNDDIELCENDWLDRMVSRAMQPYVGSVGLKLYYPDSVKIQHDGIVNLPVGPVHKLQFMEDDRSYYFGRNRFAFDCVAVTGACLLIREGVFREAGGFREALRVAYNDVDLGFRLMEMGYYNVVLNDRFAWHHESLSRGNDESPEKMQRLTQERELLYQMHPRFRGEDPFYPRGLNREGLDSRVVPAYLTDRNILQEPSWKTGLPGGETLQSVRRDDCLMARVETAGPERIQGYSVVLGDDNACYEKYLLLIPCKETEEQRVWSMKLMSAYRQELEENLPDQKNVALDGFCVRREGEQLPAGNYTIAVLAVNRVSRLKLWNTTGKYMTVELPAAKE